MMLDAEFVAKPSPWRMALLLLASLGFVTAGMWMVGVFGDTPRPGKEWIGWASIIFFGFGAVVLGKRLLNTDDVLRLGDSGLWYRLHSDDVIPWAEIADVGSWETRGARFVVLKLHHPERYPATGIAGALSGANRSMTGGDVMLTMTGTDRSFDEVMAEIERYVRR